MGGGPLFFYLRNKFFLITDFKNVCLMFFFFFSSRICFVYLKTTVWFLLGL
jgi:hypothetical protein